VRNLFKKTKKNKKGEIKMLVNCKACGKEIAKGVNKCVHCGKDQRNFLSRHKILTGILAIFILSVVGTALSRPSTAPTVAAPTASVSAPTPVVVPVPTPAPVTVTAPVPTMDKANFDKIKNGMSYKEVSSIVGPGTLQVESGTPGSDMYTVSYGYTGEGDLGANAQLMFQGDKLSMKAQIGLK